MKSLLSYCLFFLSEKVHQNSRSYHNICHSRRRSHLGSIQPYNLIQPFSRDMIISPWILIWQLDFSCDLDAFAHPLRVGEQERLIDKIFASKNICDCEIRVISLCQISQCDKIDAEFYVPIVIRLSVSWIQLFTKSYS